MNQKNSKATRKKPLAQSFPHTPGPWKVVENGKGSYGLAVLLDDGDVLPEIGLIYTDNVDPDQAVGDARLFAAAPTMLYRLQRLREYLIAIRYLEVITGGTIDHEITTTEAAIALAIQGVPPEPEEPAEAIWEVLIESPSTAYQRFEVPGATEAIARARALERSRDEGWDWSGDIGKPPILSRIERKKEAR